MIDLTPVAAALERSLSAHPALRSLFAPDSRAAAPANAATGAKFPRHLPFPSLLGCPRARPLCPQEPPQLRQPVRGQVCGTL